MSLVDDRRAGDVYEVIRGGTEGQRLGVAARGAEILRVYEGPYTNQVTYRQRCDTCGYLPPNPPITVSILPYSTEAYGTYHADSFICSFCGNRQMVEIQG